MKNDFEPAAWEAFQEAAADKYDFTTCQRPDGSKYGSSGRCIKGSETTAASKDDKKGSSKSGGGATLDKASRAEYGNQAKRERQSAADIKSEMKRSGKTPELEKKLKQTEARAAKFERMSKTGVFEPAKKASSGGGASLTKSAAGTSVPGPKSANPGKVAKSAAAELEKKTGTKLTPQAPVRISKTEVMSAFTDGKGKSYMANMSHNGTSWNIDNFKGIG